VTDLSGRTVLPADLEFGWLCEGCEQPFDVGDIAYPQAFYLDGDWLGEGAWLCGECAP
jgi:hypothetical protein